MGILVHVPFIDMALYHRMLMVAEWLVTSIYENRSSFYVCLLSLLVFHYLSISVASKYIRLTFGNLVEA